MRRRTVPASLLLLGMLCTPPLFGQDRTLYVNPGHQGASDLGPGTSTVPLESLQQAVDRALANRRRGLSSEVRVEPGTYRESVELATHGADDSAVPPITIVAVGPGAVVLSGSEVVSDLVNEGSNVWSTGWPDDWGMVDDPSRGARYVAPLVRRREMVFVDGTRLLQVEQRKRLVPGTFWFDERGQRLLLIPPAGTNLPRAVVEVAQRDRVLRLEHAWDVRLEGIRIQHAATPWTDGMAAFRINGGGRITLRDLTVTENNGTGLWVGQARDIHIAQSSLNDNGWDGLRLWRDIDVRVDSSATNGNNWRGDLGQYHGWSVGNKIHETHGLRITHHEARGNRSRGLWLDEDNRDVVITDSDLSGNLTDGIFVEANPGPVRITGTRFQDNGGFGVRVANSSLLTVSENQIERNRRGGLEIMGAPAGRALHNFQTGEAYQALYGQVVLSGNRVLGSGHDQEEGLLVGRLTEPAWARFLSELESANNVWSHPSKTRVFLIPGKLQPLTLAQWSQLTGQDRKSEFRGG